MKRFRAAGILLATLAVTPVAAQRIRLSASLADPEKAARKDSIQSVENGKRKIIRDDYTGKIETVNNALLEMLLNAGYLPVIAPVAVSEKGEALNVDADRAAASL